MQTSSSFVKQPISYFFWLGFLSRNYWSSLDHDPLAFEKKAISILVGNLNSGRSDLITAVCLINYRKIIHSLYLFGWIINQHSTTTRKQEKAVLDYFLKTIYLILMYCVICVKASYIGIQLFLKENSYTLAFLQTEKYLQLF